MMNRVEMNEEMLEAVTGGKGFVNDVVDVTKTIVEKTVVNHVKKVYEPVKKIWDCIWSFWG